MAARRCNLRSEIVVLRHSSWSRLALPEGRCLRHGEWEIQDVTVSTSREGRLGREQDSKIDCQMRERERAESREQRRTILRFAVDSCVKVGLAREGGRAPTTEKFEFRAAPMTRMVSRPRSRGLARVCVWRAAAGRLSTHIARIAVGESKRRRGGDNKKDIFACLHERTTTTTKGGT